MVSFLLSTSRMVGAYSRCMFKFCQWPTVLHGECVCVCMCLCVFNILNSSVEGLMLKLKLQHFGHLICRTDSLEKTGREGDNRGWDGWMASPTQWTWVWANSRIWQWTGKPGMLQSMGLQRVRHDWATELNNSTMKEFQFLHIITHIWCSHLNYSHYNRCLISF